MVLKGMLIIGLTINFNVYGQEEKDSTEQISSGDSLNLNNLNEIVISTSRLTESFLKSSVSIEQLKSSEVKYLASVSCFDALESVKGVQVITPSLGFKVINTRGFANTTNVRFTQLVDGMDNQAPHIGAPIGNALGANDLDIDKVEIVPGTASALYGLNAINGLANILTKNPFIYEGLSLQQLTGINHLGKIDCMNPQSFSQTNLRYARVFNSKFAFKINGSITDGTDWIANSTFDLAAAQNASTGLTGLNNPALDEVNSYGNESSNRRTLTLNGKKYVVARTGYKEEDITDYSIQNYKGDVGLYFRPQKGLELVVAYKGALINNVYQRSNRFKLQDYTLHQFSMDYHSNIFQIKTYLTNENTGKSYNIRSLAENMDRSFKSDNQWYTDYSSAYTNATNGGMSVSDAHISARVQADNGRYIPGTDVFDQKKSELIAINNWDQGAALRVKSNLLHLEGLMNWDELFPSFFKILDIHMLSGFDYRNYFITPDGNYFINPTDSGRTLQYGKKGGFFQLNKDFFKQTLKVSAILRIDKADYFSVKYNPRITAVYSPVSSINIRTSYQSGYRFPSIFEGFSNVNSGGVKRIGGLPVMSNGIFENSYTKTSIDAFQAQNIVDINANGYTTSQAIEKNKGMLKKNPYMYLQPEFVKSFEIGVKGALLKKKLYFDLDFYYNSYDNFIAQVEVSVPNTKLPDSIPAYLNSKTTQTKYRLWTNSKSKIYNYGTSFGFNYQLNDKISFLGNISYAKLDRIDDKDGLEDGFNTPDVICNGTIVAKKCWKNLGTGITYRYQTKYDYVSFLVSGVVPSYWTLDAQLNYEFEKSGLFVKLGATNLLNKSYFSILGGPSIGGFYYLSMIWRYGNCGK